MRRLIKPLFWTLFFLVMLLALDQFLVQVPPLHPAHKAVTDFYRDFRSRLIDLAFGEKRAAPKSIEAVITQKQQADKGRDKTPAAKGAGEKKSSAAAKATPAKAQRYLYADGKGELHFVDSLDEVPDEYRGQAQPMSE
jgi:hypothetical protein